MIKFVHLKSRRNDCRGRTQRSRGLDDPIIGKTKCKVRIVVRGDQELKHRDSKNIFSPVASTDGIRMALMLFSTKKIKVKQLDLRTAYFHGRRQQPIYISLPLGHPKRDGRKFVWKTRTVDDPIISRSQQ